MSPFFAVAIPTVVVILEPKRDAALSAFGGLCDNQNQTPKAASPSSALPASQRISLRPHRDFGFWGSVISNTAFTFPEPLARGELTSFLMMRFFYGPLAFPDARLIDACNKLRFQLVRFGSFDRKDLGTLQTMV
jgi:hypothetical protein